LLAWNKDAPLEMLVEGFRRVVIEERQRFEKPPSEAEIVQIYLKARLYPVLQLIDLDLMAVGKNLRLQLPLIAKLLEPNEIADPKQAERLRKTVLPVATKALSLDYIVALTHLVIHRIQLARAMPGARDIRRSSYTEEPDPPSIFESPIMFGAKKKR
jgi:hypothetical protein